MTKMAATSAHANPPCRRLHPIRCPENNRSSGDRGRRRMTSSSSASASKTSEQTGSITISRNAMCIGPKRIGRPNISGSRARPAIGTWTANMKPIAFRRLSKIRRPSRMALTIDPKSSSSRTIEDASRATSVPRPPIAMPMCAALSDGASLTPSPVMATISPFDLSALTIRSFCSGMIRANTVAVRTRCASPASSIILRSSPVTTSPVSRPA